MVSNFIFSALGKVCGFSCLVLAASSVFASSQVDHQGRKLVVAGFIRQNTDSDSGIVDLTGIISRQLGNGAKEFYLDFMAKPRLLSSGNYNLYPGESLSWKEIGKLLRRVVKDFEKSRKDIFKSGVLRASLAELVIQIVAQLLTDHKLSTDRDEAKISKVAGRLQKKLFVANVLGPEVVRLAKFNRAAKEIAEYKLGTLVVPTGKPSLRLTLASVLMQLSQQGAWGNLLILIQVRLGDVLTLYENLRARGYTILVSSPGT